MLNNRRSIGTECDNGKEVGDGRNEKSGGPLHRSFVGVSKSNCPLQVGSNSISRWFHTLRWEKVRVHCINRRLKQAQLNTLLVKFAKLFGIYLWSWLEKYINPWLFENWMRGERGCNPYHRLVRVWQLWESRAQWLAKKFWYCYPAWKTPLSSNSPILWVEYLDRSIKWLYGRKKRENIRLSWGREKWRGSP